MKQIKKLFGIFAMAGIFIAAAFSTGCSDDSEEYYADDEYTLAEELSTRAEGGGNNEWVHAVHDGSDTVSTGDNIITDYSISWNDDMLSNVYARVVFKLNETTLTYNGQQHLKYGQSGAYTRTIPFGNHGFFHQTTLSYKEFYFREDINAWDYIRKDKTIVVDYTVPDDKYYRMYI